MDDGLPVGLAAAFGVGLVVVALYILGVMAFGNPIGELYHWLTPG